MYERSFADSMGYLGLAYGKEFTQIELTQYYDFLKEYTDETLTEAIKNIIKSSKFMPKISDLIDECERCKGNIKFEILETMKNHGYFKDVSEYEKAGLWISKNCIPDWFREEMKKYYLLSKQEKLGTNKKVLIGE